jgi:ADP-dependent NAD(P)H-hydrate dehydratase / NAD(P)H-hydrate epimerase
MFTEEGSLLSYPKASVLRVDALRRFEATLFKSGRISQAALMDKAGHSAWQRAQVLWPESRHWGCFLGHGHNAGDAAVFAQHALKAGHTVSLYGLEQKKDRAALVQTHLSALKEAGAVLKAMPKTLPNDVDVWLDGLLGIGCNRALSGPLAAAVDLLNQTDKPIFSLDLPSGVCADSGAVFSCAVRATATHAFLAYKLGLFRGEGKSQAGVVSFDDLGFSVDEAASFDAPALRLMSADLPAVQLPSKPLHVDKHAMGHVFILGGDLGYLGALILAGRAALKTGAGRVTLVTRAEHARLVALYEPCLMTHAFEGLDDEGDALASLLKQASSVVVGPGLGRHAWGAACLRAACLSGVSLLLDADALNLMGMHEIRSDAPKVLTPHVGEAARLLSVSREALLANPWGHAHDLAQAQDAIVLLKGAGTLVLDVKGSGHVCPLGNPGMAQAGSGDVLAGVVGALMAMGKAPYDAAVMGAWVHAWAADLYAEDQDGFYGMPVSDWVDYIAYCINAQVSS